MTRPPTAPAPPSAWVQTQVTCLYAYTEAEIPGRAKDRRLAAEEGVHFEYLVKPLQLIAGEDGSLAGVGLRAHYASVSR